MRLLRSLAQLLAGTVTPRRPGLLDDVPGDDCPVCRRFHEARQAGLA